nr:ATP-dependent DNA ligase [Amycolatopsis sp. SID8362]
MATLTDRPFSAEDWIFEREPALYSRNRKVMDNASPEIVEALADRGSARFVADGEIAAFDDHDSTVQWKALLRDVFDFDEPLRLSSHRNADGEKFSEETCRRGWECVIAKRSPDWLKFKCAQGQELVIGGFTDPQGARHGFGALLLGYHEDGGLKYAGKVGTGFDERLLASLHARLRDLETPDSPFDGPVGERGAHWVRPELVAQIGFSEWTRDGRLRHPRFAGLREDKKAVDVVRERA